MGPIADKLLADVITLERKARTLSYQPDELANGANGLLDEVASSKITGEEDRYSHTDLSDFVANVSGSQTTFGLLAPALRAKDAKLYRPALQGGAGGARDRSARAARSRATPRSATPSASSSAASSTSSPSRSRESPTSSGADLRVALLVLVLLGVAAAPARAADDVSAGLLDEVAVQYRQAAIAHDTTLAARLRTETRLLAAAGGTPALARLARTLRATRDPLRPWPLAGTVDALTARAGARPVPPATGATVRRGAERAGRAGDGRCAPTPSPPPFGSDWAPGRRHSTPRSGGCSPRSTARAGVATATARARTQLTAAEQSLGDVRGQPRDGGRRRGDHRLPGGPRGHPDPRRDHRLVPRRAPAPAAARAARRPGRHRRDGGDLGARAAARRPSSGRAACGSRRSPACSRSPSCSSSPTGSSTASTGASGSRASTAAASTSRSSTASASSRVRRSGSASSA